MKTENCCFYRSRSKSKTATYFGIKSLIFIMLLFTGFLISQQLTSQSLTNAGSFDKISWQQQFDKIGRLSKLIDPAGRETTITYSTDSSWMTFVTKTNADGNVVKLGYNNRGQLNSMTDVSGTVACQYDDFGRLIQVLREGEPAIRYKYDLENRITNQTVGEFYVITYTYDFLGRLSSINTPAGTISYDYQTGQGQVIRKLPNGVRTIWEFSVNGQLLKTTHLDPDNYVLAEFQYQYRPDGLIEAIAEKTQISKVIKYYEYDNVGRLIRAFDESGSDDKYEYDQLGNRLQTTSTGGEKQMCEYDWAGRLTKLNGKECSYDVAGNLNSIVFGNSKMNFQYNQDCQLIRVNDKVFYKYDGDGKLIERLVASEITRFISNPLSDFWQPLVMENITEGRTLLFWDGNTPLIVIKNGKPEYILADHLSSSRLIVNEQGKVIQHIDYDPFGTIKNELDVKGLTPGFSGLFYDSEAKLYLTKARAYNPILGQFQQIEPLKQIPSGSQKELTLYAYCGNDPVNFVDRNGTWPTWIWGPENWAWQSVQLAKDDFKYFWFTPTRNEVINQIMDNAINNSQYHNNYEQAFHLAKAWRFNLELYKSNNPTAIIPTPAEFQIAENTMFTRYNPKAAIAVPVWSYIHYKGEKSGGKITPSTYGFKGDTWERQTWKTVVYPIIGGIEGTLKRLDDVICPPAYGDEIKSFDNINPNNGIFQSTTGPGKRGRRGGGITRPTSWQPPPRNVSPGKQPPLGGKPPENYPKPSANYSLTPSNVGGVYLGGAGQSLEGIGQIEGLSLDANNNLVLISKKGDQINMPPLRIDDVVTVFRSVYIHGEGPTVTIDPNPVDPENSAMIIKHDTATEETYVGWILYQADRLMKCYMLGVDNNSAKDMVSSVPGYKEILDAIYFGDGVVNNSKREGKWERFWIVPAQVNQFVTNTGNLTLFDVPLKVKTQVMKWKNGVLVDDSSGKSSAGAAKFIEWFTTNYDAISNEQYLQPPPGIGQNDPVPVFAELKRIALITAIAERMRNQGIPMPFWMRDYEIQPVHFEKYTPGLQITQSKGNYKSQIFGGVSLSPETREVKQFTSTIDLKQLNESERENGEKKLELANTLSDAVIGNNTQNKPLQNTTFEIERESYQTIQIPGSETKALSPCRIEEVDMIVAIPGGNAITLSRNFNSFFNPKDIWGHVWTMDLPRLEKVRIPVERTANKTNYQSAYELVTPLNSLYVKFSDVKEVEILNAKLQVPDMESSFFGLSHSKPVFLNNPTLELIGKNGESWHFTENGDFIAIEKDGFRVVYLRNQNGMITQIAGLLGKNIMATIDLKYDSLNRVVSATGKNEFDEEQTITYEYDSKGRLSGIISANGTLGYTYEKSRVSEETWQNSTVSGVEQNTDKMILHRFEYNTNGQLMAQFDENDRKVNFAITTDQRNTTLKIIQSDDSTRIMTMSYDSTFRPIETQYEDGTQVKWMYPRNGGSSIEFSDFDGIKAKISETSDGTKRTFDIPEQPSITETYDQAGRLTQLNISDQTLFKQQWSPFGKLLSLETENYVISPKYDEDGITTSITRYPPGSGDQLKKWENIYFDFSGKPQKISDYSGLQMSINYDNNGLVTQMVTERDGRNYGYGFLQNENGQIESVQSSWGDEQYQYDSIGELSKMIIKKPGLNNEKQAVIEFDSGRLNRIVQFDGSQTEITYHNDSLLVDLPEQIRCPNGLKLSYDYDNSGMVQAVAIGTNRRMNFEYDTDGRIISFNLQKQFSE